MAPIFIREADAPMESPTDRNIVRFGAATACGGIVLGLITLVVDMLIVGFVALALALVAGVGTLVLSRRLAEVRSQAAGLDTRVDQLEAEVATQTGGADPRGTAPPGADVERLPADTPSADMDHRSAGDNLTDATTGLFSEGYFRVALDARLSAARRHLRPVAVVLMDVVDGLGDGLPRPTVPTAVAEGIKETVRDADTACRLKDGRFALVLEDTPENGAIWTIERVRRHLAERHTGQTLWAGVACYPAHAFDAEEILKQAEDALVAAREWRQDRIEVASAS